MPRITRMWAYLSVDPKTGDEGVCAMTLPNGVVMPLIAADLKRLAGLESTAEQLARDSGMRIQLVEFTERRDLHFVGEKSK
jgi:hypothetical protein